MKGTLAAVVKRQFTDAEKKHTLLHCNCTRSEVVRVCQSVFSNISTATEAKKMVVPELQEVFLKSFLEL